MPNLKTKHFSNMQLKNSKTFNGSTTTYLPSFMLNLGRRYFQFVSFHYISCKSLSNCTILNGVDLLMAKHDLSILKNKSLEWEVHFPRINPPWKIMWFELSIFVVMTCWKFDRSSGLVVGYIVIKEVLGRGFESYYFYCWEI